MPGTPTHTRVGVFAVGLAAYWPQFPGLEESIRTHLGHIVNQMGEYAEVVDGGLVDTAASGSELGNVFAREDLDLVCCYVGTYATSTQAYPVLKRAGAPVLLLNLQPVPAMDYANADTTEALANAGVCSVPELAGVLLRAGIPYSLVTGTVYDDETAWDEIRAWCQAAGVARDIRTARFGLLGHTYPGMIDMSMDAGIVHQELGAHVEILEMNDLETRVTAASADAVGAVRTRADEMFDAASDISPKGWDHASRVAVGIGQLVSDFHLDGLAYYYRGAANSETEAIAANMILGNTLITADGVPAAGEGDLKTAIAMRIMQGLGCGGSFCEFASMDLAEGFFLMGHDGPADISLGEGRTVLRELTVFHGKSGGGLAVQMRAKLGPVTVMGLTIGVDGRLHMVVAEGENLPGPVPEIGNSLNRVRLGSDPRTFLAAWCAQGPTHHVAMGLGHRAADLARVASLLGLPFHLVN